MTYNKFNNNEKQAELLKYRDLVLATIDYYLDNKLMQVKTSDFDSDEHYKRLKAQTEEHYQKGRLIKLKQWFRDLTEMQVETGEWRFNKYLQDKTKYSIDIFKQYFQRVELVIFKGKITTDKQFYEINTLVDQLCQTEPIDKKKIDILNKLLGDYEQRKSIKTKKPTCNNKILASWV